jgi:hypothetical protein
MKLREWAPACVLTTTPRHPSLICLDSESPFDVEGRNQNKWSPLKAAMHQLLDKVINKQAAIVID